MKSNVVHSVILILICGLHWRSLGSFPHHFSCSCILRIHGHMPTSSWLRRAHLALPSAPAVPPRHRQAPLSVMVIVVGQSRPPLPAAITIRACSLSYAAHVRHVMLRIGIHGPGRLGPRASPVNVVRCHVVSTRTGSRAILACGGD